MASTLVMDGKVSEECPDVSLAPNQSFTSEDRSTLANSSFENSPLLDKEKFLRYSARSQDEFWDALSSNYDYLMDDGLIATCREASSDLSLDDDHEIPEACYWSFNQFIEQFKWLHDLLHNIQVAKEGGNSGSDSKILEEQQKVAYLCKLFNDQAQRLSMRYPDMRDEVHIHLNRLNNKWKAVELSINPNKVKSPSKDCVFNEITNLMRNVRKWLRDVETRLVPVNLDTSWTLESLEKRYKEQEDLQKEIEGKGKHISSLIKLCEHLKGNVQFGQNSVIPWDAEGVRKVAKNLEHSWHSLWLKSLECHCILEELMQSYAVDSDFEKSFTGEEPLKKYPRLTDNCEELLLLENELKGKINFKMEDLFDDESFCCDHIQQTDPYCPREECLKNDKGVMVGDTGIAELKAECQRGNGKFEIIQDVGYSSETSAHLSNDEKLDSPEAHLTRNLENKSTSPTNICKSPANNSDSFGTPSKLYLPPDKYPSVSLKTLHILSEDKPLFNSKYGSCKAVPDSFYKVTSVDDEIFKESTDVSKEIDVPSKLLVPVNVNSKKSIESNATNVSNNISSLKPESNSNAQPSTEKNVILQKESHIKSSLPSDINTSNSVERKSKKTVEPLMNDKEPQSNELWKKSSRVQEWLETCQTVENNSSDDNLDSSAKNRNCELLNKTTDSSCDASGECTTESDSEKSNMSDVNNSVTLSQSFTGSIETVIPVVQEETAVAQSDRGGSIERMSGVRMRKKKRPTRDRPWSVTDVHNSSFVSSLVPHSTSESALDLLCSSQDSKKLGSKKNSTDNKRLSLTDVSTKSCPSIKSFKNNQINPKNSNSKSKFNCEKTPLRRKKGLGSDKSSDKYDSVASSDPQRESSKETVDPLKSLASSAVSKTEKTFALESSSLETSMLSENEKSESVANAEDQGSISWDEYQDPPYLSEPYSEQTADEDEVKKLINFGDDYRAMLGSYSDASSISLKAPLSKSHKTRSKSYYRKGSSQESRDSLMSDSNSDSEDFQNILRTSNRALQFVSNTLKENTQKMTLFSTEFAELVATCQTNLCHLHAIHNELVSGCELESLSKEDILKLQDLIKEWEALQVKLLTLSRNDEQKSKNAELEAAVLDVHCSLAALKEKLSTLATSIKSTGEPPESLNQLKQNIQALQNELSNLQETKESVMSVSARVFRLVAEGGGTNITGLRDNATKLYQQWEDVYELNCSQLTKLQALQSRWHEYVESEMNSSSETTIQWHPVQVGSSLPTPEVSTEEFFESAAAEVQVADKHDVLFEIETDSEETLQCAIEKDDLSESLHLLCPPPVHTRRFRLETLDEETEVDSLTSNSKKASYFWRTLRATVPIQFALVILYCMSCLMEPQCCGNMNNYDYSLSPHLHYPRGPPPI